MTSPNEATTTIQPSTTTPIDDEVVPGWRTVTISDPERTISEVATPDGSVRLEASTERNFETILVYSASEDGGENSSPRPGQRPLIVWLNGLGGRASPGDPMISELMSSGYVVAAPIVPELADPVGWAPAYVEQPADVSRVIDALLDPTDGVADDLAAVIDGDRIGVVGHSIGASGAFGLAFHDCCRDERVDAVVGIGGNPVAFGFDPPGFVFTGTPLLVVHGDQDDISPVELGESVIASADEPAYLLTVPDADHFSPVYPAGGGDAFGISWSATAAFFDQHVAGVDDAWESFVDEAPESFPSFNADLVTSASG